MEQNENPYSPKPEEKYESLRVVAYRVVVFLLTIYSLLAIFDAIVRVVRP